MFNLGFLVLAPKTIIPFHTDEFGMFGSWHMGLIVPPLCALEMPAKTVVMSPGACVAFEDAWVHRAWNLSNEPRVTLAAWVAHPTLSEAERAALAVAATELGWAH